MSEPLCAERQCFVDHLTRAAHQEVKTLADAFEAITLLAQALAYQTDLRDLPAWEKFFELGG